MQCDFFPLQNMVFGPTCLFNKGVKQVSSHNIAIGCFYEVRIFDTFRWKNMNELKFRAKKGDLSMQWA